MVIVLAVLAAAVVVMLVPGRRLGGLKGPLLVSALLAAVVLGPLWTTSGAVDDAYDPARITDYRAGFTLAENGDLEVSERLTVQLPAGRHGIFRFFDVIDTSAPHARRIPEDVRVTRNGEPDEVEHSRRERGRFRVVRVGSPDVTIDGTHVYRIDYTIRGVIEPGTTGERSQFYWNLIPGGWSMPIEQATLTVDLPVPASGEVRCAVGQGETGGCEVAGAGTRNLVVQVADLEPRTPVTVLAGLDLATPDAGDSVPWTSRWDPVLGHSLSGALTIGLLALLAAGYGWGWWWRVRESTPPAPLTYSPPEGIGPAQASFLSDEEVNRNQLLATVMYLAEQGAISLTRNGSSWTMKRADLSVESRLDDVSAAVLRAFALQGRTSLRISAGDSEGGSALRTAENAMRLRLRTWAEKAGLLAPVAGVRLHAWLGAIATVLVPVLVIVPLPTGSLVAAIPAAYAGPAVTLWYASAARRRTQEGRRVWSEIAGFRRMLGTASGEARFDFAAREDAYLAYLPWAVVFGVADAWAEKYRLATGFEPPLPRYLADDDRRESTMETTPSVQGLTSGFGAAVTASIAAYTATIAPSSSSDSSSSSSSFSSGSSFSGGGGGGGGGGGSW